MITTRWRSLLSSHEVSAPSLYTWKGQTPVDVVKLFITLSGGHVMKCWLTAKIYSVVSPCNKPEADTRFCVTATRSVLPPVMMGFLHTCSMAKTHYWYYNLGFNSFLHLLTLLLAWTLGALIYEEERSYSLLDKESGNRESESLDSDTDSEDQRDEDNIENSMILRLLRRIVEKRND